VYHDRPHTLNELKTAVTVYVRNITQADLQKVFASKIKRVQACIDARGHHFQYLLYAQSDFPNALYMSKQILLASKQVAVGFTIETESFVFKGFNSRLCVGPRASLGAVPFTEHLGPLPSFLSLLFNG
jgi:hypothetical protein